MNDVLNVIAKRASCRKFTPDLPTPDQLSLIASAAVTSPSSVNKQRWRVIVLKDKALIDELEKHAISAIETLPDDNVYKKVVRRRGTLFYGAPSIFFLPVDDPASPESALDCGIVAQTIALAATSLGLGSLICGLARYAFTGAKADYFARKLGFPDGFAFGTSVLIGTPDGEFTPHQPDLDKISYVG